MPPEGTAAGPAAVAAAVRSFADALRRRGDDADVYAWGVALCRAVTGGPPSRRPALRPSAMPAELDLVVRRATAADPAFRFRSAAEFAAALDDLAGGLGDTKARRPEPLPVRPVSPARHRLAVVAGALAAGLTALVAVGAVTGHPGAVFGPGRTTPLPTGPPPGTPVSTRGWSAVSSPGPAVLDPAGATSLPGAPAAPTDGLLSCPAPTFCVAVVATFTTSGASSVLDVYAAGTWTATPAPTTGLDPPAAAGQGPAAELEAVRCPAPGWCVAVGRYGDTGGGYDGLAVVLSGGSWTAASVPGASGGGLDQVACTGVGACVATGRTATAAALWALGPGGWTMAPPDAALAVSAGAVPRLDDVACGATRGCVAVGHTYSAAGTEEGLVEAQAEGGWRRTIVPGPKTGDTASLDDIACTEGGCVAVGGTDSPDGSLAPLVETLAAGTWRTARLPTVGRQPGVQQWTYLTSVSCASARLCAVTAWSYARAAGERIQGILFTDVGGHWHARSPTVAGLAPAAAPGPDVVPWSVSCSDGQCVAVGGYQDATGTGYGFVDTFRHGAWRAVTAPTAGLVPGAGPDPRMELEAVLCPGVPCTALGVYEDVSGTVRGMLARGTNP